MFNTIILMTLGLIFMLASLMDALTGFNNGLFMPLALAVIGLFTFFAPLIESTLEG